MNKAIVIGASSGIGRELAKVISENGHAVGLVARRGELLADLQGELAHASYASCIDIAETDEAMLRLRGLIDTMGGVDTIIICSAVTLSTPEIDWPGEVNTLNVNVLGVAAMANVAFNYFCANGGGHLVGISSFKAHRGGGRSPAYNASKAFLSNYLEGLRINSARLGKKVRITDIRPGLVDSSPAGERASFWVAPAGTVARQIYRAIEAGAGVAYTPGRYRYIGYLMSSMPFSLYRRLKR